MKWEDHVCAYWDAECHKMMYLNALFNEFYLIYFANCSFIKDLQMKVVFLSWICKCKIQNQGFSRISPIFFQPSWKSLDSNAHICYIGWKDKPYYPIVPKQDSIPKHWSRAESNRNINWCGIVTASKSLPADKLKLVDDSSIDDGVMIMTKQISSNHDDNLEIESDFDSEK